MRSSSNPGWFLQSMSKSFTIILTALDYASTITTNPSVPPDSLLERCSFAMLFCRNEAEFQRRDSGWLCLILHCGKTTDRTSKLSDSQRSIHFPNHDVNPSWRPLVYFLVNPPLMTRTFFVGHSIQEQEEINQASLPGLLWLSDMNHAS